MAMTKCRDCGSEISTMAKACPKCGAPQGERLDDYIDESGGLKQALPESLTRKRPTSVAAWVVSAFVLLVLASIFDRDSSSPPAASAASGTNVGAKVHLAMPGSTQGLVLATDEAAHEAYVEAAVANDTMGISQLMVAGRAFMVPTATLALVLDKGLGRVKVRILEGEQKGRAGWLASEWVRAAQAVAANDSVVKPGAKIYETQCVACHQSAGQGTPPNFPSLVGSTIANGPAVAHIEHTLNGKNLMPSFAYLSDGDLAAVISYVRTSWGNTGGPVSTAEVKLQRKK